MAVLGSSLFISHPHTCSWVSFDANLAFDDTFLYDWPIWKYGYVIYKLILPPQNNLIIVFAVMVILIQAIQTHQAMSIQLSHQLPGLKLQIAL